MSHNTMKTLPFSKNNTGFSLIEVTIALLVIALILGSILTTYNVYMAGKKDNDTKARIENIQAALSKFASSEGYYPKPADRDIPIGTAGFGAAVATVTLPCNTNPEKACVTTGVSNVYVGDIPFAALGIRYDNTLDSYGRKMTYAVSAPLTAIGTFSDIGGVINPITESGGVQHAGAPSDPLAHYFVFSSGPDGQGAYNLSGALFRACGTVAANGQDVENCNGDNVFRSNYDTNPANALTTYKKIVRKYAGGASQFDDWSGYKNSSKTGLWAEIPGLGELTNTNGGNVMVGAPTFGAACAPGPCVDPPKTKLEVRGATKATELRTGRFCYNSGDCPLASAGLPRNEISPLHFAVVPTGLIPNATGAVDTTTWGNQGGGILCSGNKALRGFHLGDELCSNSVRTANPAGFGDCNTAVTGLYPTGIDATGRVKCN